VRPEIRCEIEQLNARYAWSLDLQDYVGLREVFTPDAVYASRGQTFVGAEQIIASFAGRESGRTTRHGWSSLWLAAEPDRTVSGRSTWFCFAGFGSIPAPRADVYTVADFHDTYILAPQGWRIAQRTIVPIFRDSALAPR